MKNFSNTAKAYILGTILVGLGLLVSQFQDVAWGEPGLYLLAALGAAAQTLKVEGPNDKTNYNIAWLLYGFTFVSLGLGAVLFVILIAHLAEWLKHRYPWYIQTFNIAVYALVAVATDFVYRSLNPANTPLELQSALALVVALLTFTLLNHLLVGIVIQLARGQNLRESGVFEFLPLATDFTLLGLGAASALLFLVNPFGALLNVIPVYLLYQALKVPALGRRIRDLEKQLSRLEPAQPAFLE